MDEGKSQPRLIVRDASGRRTVPLDKPVLTFGRRSESDVRLAGADVSRLAGRSVRRLGAVTLVVAVHDGMPLAPPQQPAVHREGRGAGDHQRYGKAAPEAD